MFECSILQYWCILNENIKYNTPVYAIHWMYQNVLRLNVALKKFFGIGNMF